ncbi:hypothetical protein SELMODRAFT_438394 [Selaginella moellendorffii]|uniref:rRNA-processing protein EFG1 n=1 Tax=Selaginella moellendorffii TaxID=88036 RepID=D8QXP4_SELML|nr:rRNA-processing protein EFG1 [Selaginella moellendorffii]EFJ35460.1 hypothetical protein SELMODRAFT_438394 [Selaginella moellendorffii]|eukprot:XP_002963589.1 rRNA-processing protein EFG1 [Selaginella moellendorffii]
MAHGPYAKRRVAGRSPSLGGGYAARSSRGLAVRGKEGDRKAIRNQIRSIERLLKKTLPLEIKTAHEKRLEDLRRQAELHAHRKLALRDRKLKFFERRKLERRIRRLEKQHRWNLDHHPHQANASRQIAGIADQLARLKEDLEYVRFFPKSERYVSLFIGSDDELTRSRRLEIREKIKSRRSAAVAAGTELEETGSEDEEPMDLSEDDIFIEGSSSDDADADDEWTDRSPRPGDDRDDTSRDTDVAPQHRERRESAARVLMPPPRAMNTNSMVVRNVSVARNNCNASYSSSTSEDAMLSCNSSSGISSEVIKVTDREPFVEFVSAGESSSSFSDHSNDSYNESEGRRN